MPSPDTLIIAGDESQRLDPDLPDGGIPLLPGVQAFQVFRAARAFPELSDGKGYTYHHHVDIACWRGLLYVAWNSCERDEDVWPSRELYATSSDGATWSKPQELFPQGVSTSLRMYFFLAPTEDRMLAFAGLRASTEIIDEDAKGSLVVREITTDHKLGPVFTLQKLGAVPANAPPMFMESKDVGFVEACQELLADRVFLEQQDRGRLLGSRAMKWHDERNWPGGKFPTEDSSKWVPGKAYSFFKRDDSTSVGICKMGFTTFSHDRGISWSRPAIPETLITGKAKVWAQHIHDGGYVLVYNPSRENRYPLALTTSSDGVHFSPLRVVQGELPVQRYDGEHRSIGPQYTRGISAWSTDYSRKDNCLWLVYSMSKEDIWVTRVPLPIQPPQPLSDDFGESLGPIIPRWNTYAPKWTNVSIQQSPARDGHCLLLRDSDPYDYASATRVFDSRTRVNLSFDVLAAQTDGQLEIDLAGGRQRGQAHFIVGPDPISLAPSKWHRITILADAATSRFSVQMNGSAVLDAVAFEIPVTSLDRITFRTGAYRGIGGSHPVDPQSDRPAGAVEFMIKNVRMVD
jgi:hypothetical protein